MTDLTSTPLSYDAGQAAPNSRCRTAAWITLLVLGILTVLGGLCIGASTFMVFGFFAAKGGGARPAGTAPNWGLIIALVALVYVVLPAGFGTTEIVCALKVRRRSRAATINALVFTLFQLLLSLLIAVGAIVGAIRADPNALPAMLVSIVMFTLVAAFVAVVSVLLFRTLKEPR